MTSANSQYQTFAANMRRITGLKGGDVGTVPDEAHMDPPTGYHVSPRGIRAAGRWDRDYSTRQARDRTTPGSDACSAFDIGDDWPNGGRAAWLRWNNLLLHGLQTGDPELAAVRAINVSRDGRERKRYDTANRAAGLVDSADTVTIHTHGETWRDTIGTPSLDAAFRRIEALAQAAVANTTPGDDMDLDDSGPKAILPGATNRDVLRSMLGLLISQATGERRDDLIRWTEKDVPDKLWPALRSLTAGGTDPAAVAALVVQQLGPLPAPVLTDAQLDAVAERVVASLATRLSA